jgi:mxaJ protein
MCSVCRVLAVALAFLVAATSAAPLPAFRVCADPNNLPFSNSAGDGFENALAELIARDLRQRVEYTWWPERRGFIRSTLNAGLCDVVMGVPSGYEMVSTTVPYYRSTYAFVTRRSSHLDIRSFNDPRLRTLRIGVHIIGDDYANVPPAQALVARGIVQNVHGYSIYGNYAKPNPPADLINAVAEGAIDVAIAWGPTAGYFAAKTTPTLAVRPIAADENNQKPLSLSFDISLGVRRSETARRDRLNELLRTRQSEIRSLLQRYHVPLIASDQSKSAGVR